jgi:FAD/FMN-containing dehydrogenase
MVLLPLILNAAKLENENDFIKRCQAIIGTKYVYTSDADKSAFLTDWSKRFTGNALAVLRPKNTNEVASLIALCNKENIAIVPQGGNTGLCGGATPTKDGQSVVISTTRLNQIRELDLENSTITLDAGVVLMNAQEAAFKAGKLFPLSLAAEGSCTIGGNLSTNAGGVQVLRYGNMRDLCLGIEVVTSTGEIFNGLRGLRKDNTGYSLKDLYIGAEGSLGIITAATLKLYPLPQSKVTALVAIKDVQAGIKLIDLARESSNADLTAFELISRRALRLISKQRKNAEPLSGSQTDWVVLLEFSSMDEESYNRERLEALLENALELELISDAVIANSLQQSKDLWSIREGIPEAQFELGTVIKHDISLPISQIASFVEATEVTLHQLWPKMQTIIFGHVGDGNLHYNLAPLSPDLSNEIEERRKSINKLVHDQVYAHAGSFSAEHGIGQSKRDELPLRKSDVEIELMRSIKKPLDPKIIMTPGKVI